MRERLGLTLTLLCLGVGAVTAGTASGGPAAQVVVLTARTASSAASARPLANAPALVATRPERSPATALVPSAARRSTSIPAVGFTQEGIDRNDAKGVWDPADVTLGVGPTYLGEAVNSAVGWWRIGAGFDASGIRPLGEFFTTGNTNRNKDQMADPRLLYDPSSGHWFFTAFDITRGEINLAVSTTSDPTRPFWIFTYQAGGCPDQPRLAVRGTMVALSYDVYPSCSKRTGPTSGGVLWVWSKQPLIKGAAPQYTSYGPTPAIAGVTPAPSPGSGSAIYMLAADYTNSQVILFTVSSVGEQTIPLKPVAIQPLRLAPSPPERGSSAPLAPASNRVQDAFFSGGHIWLAANDGCSVPGPVPLQGCVRLVELSPAGQVLSQVDQALANGRSAIAPAVRPDGHGHVFSVFGYSSPRDYPGLAATVDPAVSNAYLQLKPGQAADRSGHWGDYFAAARDPRHSNRVWVAGAYGRPGGWGTYIAALSTTPFSIPRPGGTPAGTRDRTPPRVSAIRSAGVRGRPVLLRYRLSDNSRRVRTSISVRRLGHVVAVVQTPLQRIVNGRAYWATWRAPRTAPTALTFCVIAFDGSGNRSKPSCAPLRLSAA